MTEYQRAWPWFLLCGILPIIGPLILYAVKKSENPGLAEVGKWLFIGELLLLIPIVGIILWIVLLLWRFSEDKGNVYRPWYLYWAVPLIGYIIAMFMDIPSEVKKDLTILFVISIVLAVAVFLVFTTMTISAVLSPHITQRMLY